MRSFPIPVLLVVLMVGCASSDPVVEPAPLTRGGGTYTAPVSSGQRTYVVQRGDTLYALAKRYYGRGSEYRRIVAANPGLDPQRMSVGTRLVIPGASSAPATTYRAPPHTDTRVAGWSGTSGGSGGFVRLRGSTEIHRTSCPKVRRARPDGIVTAGSGGGPRCPTCH